MSKDGERIESFINVDDWKGARKLIRTALRSSPQSHWLLSRLALTYYEEFKYTKALEYDSKALEIAPKCPLALWGYAGALDMLGRGREAIKIYSKIIKRGIESLAYDQCGEGLARARGLFADSLYRIAKCYQKLGQHHKAIEYYEKHLKQRGPGCYSIYPLKDVHKEIKAVQLGKSNSKS